MKGDGQLIRGVEIP